MSELPPGFRPAPGQGKSDLPPGFRPVKNQPAPSLMSSFNRGIASVGDAASEIVFNPIDATSEFFGGPRISSTDTPFTDAFVDMGAIGGERDTSFAGRVAEGAGAAAGSLLPVGATANALAKTSGLVGEGARMVMSPFLRNPATAVGTELLAGAGAGAGGELAARGAGEEWRTTGEVLGGLGAGLAPSARPPLINQAGRSAVKAFAPYTQAGGRIAAAERLQSMSPNPQAEADAIEAAADVGGLSPAQISGNERFMALENTVRQNVPEIGADMAARDAAAVEKLRMEATKPADGATPEDAKAFYRERQERVAKALRRRAQEAQKRAQARLAEIEPKMRSTEASRILREELEAADATARQMVSELWDQVPMDVEIRTDNVFRTFDSILRDTPTAQTGDIPADARRVIEDAWNDMGIPFEGETRPDVVTMREMSGLYQKMREISRNAKAGVAPRMNLARLADSIASAVLRDIGVNDDVPTAAAEAFNIARNARKDYADTFGTGTVGRILNKTRAGGDAIDPRQSLDKTIGRGGSDALVAQEDIQSALRDNPTADGAISDYVNRRFNEYAVRDGVLDPVKADTFIRNNAELLDALLGVKKRIVSAVQSQRSSIASGERMEGLATGATDPRQNPAAAFANAPVSREFDGVLSQDNPAQAAIALSRKAARDKTGAASRGLKASATDWLIRQARTVAGGEETLSGNAYLKAFNDPRTKEALSAVFSSQEMQRLTVIGRELAAVEGASRAGNVGGEVLPSNVNSAMRFILGTMGARVGAQAGAGTAGASLRTAGMFSRRVQDIFDKLSVSQAERLLMDAVQEKDLFVSLLRDGTTPKGSQQLETRLSEWLVSAGGQPALPDDQNNAQGGLPEGFAPARQGTPRIGPSGLPEGFTPIEEGALREGSGRVADLRQQQAPPPVENARTPYKLASLFLGMGEKKNTAVLSGFIRSMTGKNLNPAETAWCAAYVNAVLAASGTQGTNSNLARSFLKFGTEAKSPKRGDIAVFSRGDPNGWQGHVGFYAGEVTKNGQQYIKVLGGNQGDAVSEKLYPANRLLGLRRPPRIAT